jgi:SET domain-containing protein
MKSRRSWRSPNTVVRKSSIHGYGLYARSLILQGEVVGRRGGEVVNARGAARRDMEWGNFSLQVAADKFLCPRTAADVAKVALFLDHGCNPNVGHRGRFAFVAMRTIDPGEELLIDYAMGKATPDEWDCTCGSPLGPRDKSAGNGAVTSTNP